MLQDLSWNNYLDLVKLTQSYKYVEKWMSFIALVTYQYYGINFKFLITEKNEIILFIQYNKTEHKTQGFWYLSQIFYFQDSNIADLTNCAKQHLYILNNNNLLKFANISEEMVKTFNFNNYYVEPYVSNYIYNIIDLQTFKGKKMQKKRNHLNAFIKENWNIEIKNIFDCNIDHVLDFINKHIKSNSENYRDYEYQIYEAFLKQEIFKDNNYSGIVIYIDGEIKAMTLGYLNQNIYEIIIEKADKNIRGLYQYLIKTNLEFNKIKAEYIDRQDDVGSEELTKSKHSYCPIYEIKRFSSK